MWIHQLLQRSIISVCRVMIRIIPPGMVILYNTAVLQVAGIGLKMTSVNPVFLGLVYQIIFSPLFLGHNAYMVGKYFTENFINFSFFKIFNVQIQQL